MADAAAIEGLCLPCFFSGKALGSLNLGVNLDVWRTEMPPTGKNSDAAQLLLPFLSELLRFQLSWPSQVSSACMFPFSACIVQEDAFMYLEFTSNLPQSWIPWWHGHHGDPLSHHIGSVGLARSQCKRSSRHSLLTSLLPAQGGLPSESLAFEPQVILSHMNVSA